MMRRFRFYPSAVAFISFFALAAVFALPGPPKKNDLYSAATMAARWLEAAEVQTPAGLAWPADPKDAQSVNTTLYAGTPGVILFYLEARAAAEAAGRKEDAAAYLDKAKKGALDLLARLSGVTETGLYEGLAGIGFVLEEAYKATGMTRFRQGFGQCLARIRARAARDGKGASWGSVTDIISGTAGTGLFLLYAAEEMKDRTLVDLAAAAGDRLIELATPKNNGLDWAMDPSYPRLMPNFSHGTAGVAFFLARLYGATGKKPFLDAALAGARYLQSIARTEGQGCLIFHHEPDGKDVFYLGWCHGPVGTAHLFYELYRITGEKVWMDWVLRQARSLMDSGIPERETPGFWNNSGICCGLAGVADFFISLQRVAKDGRYSAFADRVLGVLLGKATLEKDRMSWIQAEHRSRPEFLVAQTGLMQGAAGIGIVLLRRVAYGAGRAPAFRMPDSAF